MCVVGHSRGIDLWVWSILGSSYTASSYIDRPTQIVWHRSSYTGLPAQIVLHKSIYMAHPTQIVSCLVLHIVFARSPLCVGRVCIDLCK